ncbi:MAG: formate transporter FocA, partial [Rhodospirillaceae bacterium]|nr:formate transporter FocA [Rhodospirillaceae bacterium]
MALKAEQIGAAKARLDTFSLLALAVLAGAFIGLGALFSTVVVTGAGEMPFGVVRLLAGLVFSLGLILVVIGGAELFTGNNLMVMAAAAREITWVEMLRAWGIVYVGNLIGAVGTAALVYLGGQYLMAGGSVGGTALAIAEAKANLTFTHA